jgi:3-phenylpropionate/trans-cinnamate dioxygenase ferredoxin component
LASVRVCKVDELQPGMAVRVDLDGQPVCVVNVNGEFYAVGDTCSHEESSLSEGFIDPDDVTVECPKHGALFALRTGKNLTLPATRPVPSYAVRVKDGDLSVETKS